MTVELCLAARYRAWASSGLHTYVDRVDRLEGISVHLRHVHGSASRILGRSWINKACRLDSQLHSRSRTPDRPPGPTSSTAGRALLVQRAHCELASLGSTDNRESNRGSIGSIGVLQVVCSFIKHRIKYPPRGTTPSISSDEQENQQR